MISKSIRRNWRAAAAAPLLAAMLGACVTAKEVGSPEGVVDDGENNTVVLSYTLRMDVYELYAGNRGTTLELHCLNDGNVSGSNGCISIFVPYKGQRQDPDTGALIDTYEVSGVDVFQMPYRDYEMVDARFKVIIDREPTENCRVNRRGTLRCYTTYTNRYNPIRTNLPEILPISVNAGNGCFAGHIDLHLRGPEVLEWSVRNELTDSDIAQVAPVLRERVREHVTKSCLPGAT